MGAIIGAILKALLEFFVPWLSKPDTTTEAKRAEEHDEIDKGVSGYLDRKRADYLDGMSNGTESDLRAGSFDDQREASSGPEIGEDK